MSDPNVTRAVFIQGEAAKALLANIRDVIGDDEKMAAVAVEGETDLLEAIRSAVDRLADLDAHQVALGNQIQALSARKERFEGQAERIKAAIHVAMGHANQPRIELPRATLSVRAVAPKVEVTDEAAVPVKFWKAQDPKLDRKAVLDALKAKEDVPGATLSNGGETLALKWS